MRIKSRYILYCLALLSSCTAESIKASLLRQEQDIEKYISTMKSNANTPVDTVYYFNGVYRVVLKPAAEEASEGESEEVVEEVAEVNPGEGAAAGDSVIFNYDACIFSSGKGAQYDSGEERGTLGSGSYFAGLETGLTGMCTGEHAQIILTGEKGYGNVAVGIVPPNTPLIFEVWMTRVVKQ